MILFLFESEILWLVKFLTTLSNVLFSFEISLGGGLMWRIEEYSGALSNKLKMESSLVCGLNRNEKWTKYNKNKVKKQRHRKPKLDGC